MSTNGTNASNASGVKSSAGECIALTHEVDDGGENITERQLSRGKPIVLCIVYNLDILYLVYTD